MGRVSPLAAGGTAANGYVTNPEIAACLRALPAATVAALAGNGTTYTTQPGGPGTTPTGITQDTLSSAYVLTDLVLDGQILPTVPIEALETGNFNHVPILDGDVENEGEFFIAPDEFFEEPRAPLTEAQFVASATSTFSGNAGPGGSPPAYPPGTAVAVLAHYPLSAYPTPDLQWGQEYTNANFSCATRHVDQILASQVPVYCYEFRDQTAPSYFPSMPGFVSLAYHTGDIQYYWPLYHGGPLGIPHPLNSAQQQLSDQFVTLWANFVRTANPNGQGNTPWPRYTGADGLWLTENIAPAGVSTETDAFWATEHQCSFWDSVLVYVPASSTNWTPKIRTRSYDLPGVLKWLAPTLRGGDVPAGGDAQQLQGEVCRIHHTTRFGDAIAG